MAIRLWFELEIAVHVDTTDGQSSMDHLQSLSVRNSPGIGAGVGSLEHVLQDTASNYQCGN